MYKGINFHPYFKTFEENSDEFNYSARQSLDGTHPIHLIKFITMLIAHLRVHTTCICVVNEHRKSLETNRCNF